MEGITHITNRLFSKGIDQKTVRLVNKEVNQLLRAAKTQLIREVTDDLAILLSADPFLALTTVSLICDGCPELYESLVCTLEEILGTCITQLQNHTLATHHVNSSFHITVKALYGTMQHVLPPALQHYEKAQLLHQLHQLYKELQAALASDKLPSDCGLITATALCLIMYHVNKNNLKREFLYTLTISNHLTATKSSRSKDSLKEEIESLLKNKISNDENECNASLKFGLIEPSCQVALLFHGLFNSGLEWIYFVNKEKGSHDGHFLYEVYPLIRKLCDGATSYCFQAFQVLHMWLRAVRKLGSRIKLEADSQNLQIQFIHPSKELIFKFSCDYHNSVFHLLTSNWENPAKGVSEVVSSCMMELLNLHEDCEPGSSHVQASAMLQSLITSAAWTSKATYPPLALALSHVGVQEALSAHPSLPDSLVLSLGVNHLAPSGTCVYKVVLAHLKQAQWSECFLMPLLNALHSQHRLTRQYALSLWLPLTVRQYPSIYPELIQLCSNTTGGWMAKMATLRIARTTGLLDLEAEEEVQKGEWCLHDKETKKDSAVKKSRDYIPGSYKDVVGDGDNELFGYMDQSIPNKHSSPPSSSVMTYVWAAMRHIDENIRAEALSFLCVTRKAAQPLSTVEAECLRTFFEWNANIDSAPFRQSILKSYRALIVRIRDASAAELKKLSTSRNSAVKPLECSGISLILRVNIGMLVWFVHFFHNNLSLNGNYQRKILALQLYKETLLAFCTEVESSRYAVISRYKPVFNFINTHDSCLYGFIETNKQLMTDLSLPWTFEALLYSCLDEMNDVQMEAEEILKILGSFNSNLCLEEARAWMKRGLDLTSSPKASDVESGAAVILALSSLSCSTECCITALVEKPGGQSSCQDIMTFLLRRVKEEFRGAQDNLLQAARSAPIHGSLLALGRCLTEQEWVREMNSAAVQSFLHSLIEMLIELVEFMLSKLACASPSGSAIAPSFAEMGLSVDMIIKECSGDNDENSTDKRKPLHTLDSCQLEGDDEEGSDADYDEFLDNSIPADHLLVLACCWQTLRICCMVSGWCVERLLQYLSVDIVRRVTRGVVVRTLIATRHKGAMEAARAAYAHTCRTLLTAEGNYDRIIYEQVEELLDGLKLSQGTSVTRRGAGMAMMVQAACGAAPRLTNALFSSTITCLLTVAQSKVVANVNVDAAPVLALHLLQSLVLHAPLAPHLPPYLPIITATCFSAFTSHSWALRNAALQLYGAVVPRMMGQKKVRDDSSVLNSLTASEFIARHPALADLLLTILGGMDVGKVKHEDCEVKRKEVHESQGVKQKCSTEDIIKDKAEERYLVEEINTRKRESETDSDVIGNKEKCNSDINIQGKKKMDCANLKYSDESSCCTGDNKNNCGVERNCVNGNQLQCRDDTKCKKEPVSEMTKITVSSGLVPALSLAARLSPGTKIQHSNDVTKTLNDLRTVTSKLLGSPVHTVRRLTADAMVALTPVDEIVPCVTSGIGMLANPESSSANLIHGNLLMITNFLKTYPSLSQNMELKKTISSLQWILEADVRCYIIANLALKIMRLMHIEVNTDHTLTDLSLVGASQFSQTLLKIKMCSNYKDVIEQLLMTDALAMSDLLDHIVDHMNNISSDCSHPWTLEVEQLLWKKVEGPFGNKTVFAVLTLLNTIFKKYGRINEVPSDICMENLLLIMQGSHGAKATSLALITMAYLMKSLCTEQWNKNTTGNFIMTFTDIIKTYSAATSTEDYRLAASSALRICMKVLMNTHRYVSESCREQLIISCTQLLQDENSEVRDSASYIVCSLLSDTEHCTLTNSQSTPYSVYILHPSLALYEFALNLAFSCVTCSNWCTFRTLWKICSGQVNEETSLSDKTLLSTRSRSYLFQSHSMNLYKEPKEVSLIISRAILKALEDHTGMHTPDWLCDEEKILNQHGRKLICLINKHQELYKHKHLITAIYVYGVACQTLESMCRLFNKSVKVTYPLTWKKDRFCTIETHTA